MVTLIERESKTEIKQGQDNHTDEKAEIDLMDILRKIIGIRKIIQNRVHFSSKSPDFALIIACAAGFVD